MFQQVGRGRIEGLAIHPNQSGEKVVGDRRGLMGGGEHVSAADVELILKGDGNRHGRYGAGEITVEGGDAFDPAGSAGRQCDELIARPYGSGGDLAGEAAIVLVIERTNDALDG